jgi:hypothetical protein
MLPWHPGGELQCRSDRSGVFAGLQALRKSDCHHAFACIECCMPNLPPLPSPCCSFISYLGPFNKEFREVLLSRDFYGTCVKLSIPVTKDLQASDLRAA